MREPRVLERSEFGPGVCDILERTGGEEVNTIHISRGRILLSFIMAVDLISDGCVFDSVASVGFYFNICRNLKASAPQRLFLRFFFLKFVFGFPLRCRKK